MKKSHNLLCIFSFVVFLIIIVNIDPYFKAEKNANESLSPKEECDPINDLFQIPKLSTTPINYTMDKNNPYNWIEASSGTALLLNDDESSYQTLPFGFHFYNQTFSQVYVHSNGYLCFTSGGSIPDGSIPSSNTNLRYMIAPFWDDLITAYAGGTGTIYVNSFGTYWVAEWLNISHFDGSLAGSFEVILYNNGTIVFNYDYLTTVYSDYACGFNLGIDTRFYTRFPSPGLSSSTDNFSVSFCDNFYAPMLTNETVSPKNALHSQQFNFTVTFVDLDNEEPFYVYVYVNSSYYSMSKQNSSDNNYTDGVLYQYLTTTLDPSIYNFTYRFECSDGHIVNSTTTYTDLKVSDNGPLLTNGVVNPKSALHSQQFNFTVIFTDLDNDAPSYVRVYVNSSYYSMLKQNSSDNNYTDGVLYQYLTTALNPSIYNYTYYFVCSDGHMVNSTVTYTDLRVINYLPTLTNGTVSPKSALHAQQFNFTVIYTDLDNEAPSYVRVYVNSSYYSMSKQNSSDNNYTDGVLYRYLTTSLSPGVYNYTYRFVCSDPHNINTTATYTDLQVINYRPTLMNGNVSPKSALHSQQFNFSVIYTDLDNEAPQYIRVYINSSAYSMSKQNSSDNNYIDGVLYQFLSSTLNPGAYNYTYYFICMDSHIYNSTATYTDLQVIDHGPWLTNCNVSPKRALHSQQFNFSVIYTDIDNEAPLDIKIFINSSAYSPSKQNPSDINYTDGVLYYYLTSTLNPSIYNYTYRFAASDGHIVNNSATYTDLQVINYLPTLTNGNVSPKSAVHFQQFNFTVIYTDLDNEAPSYVRVYVNSTAYSMLKQNSNDNNYTDGVLYQYIATTLNPSIYNYTYRFQCSDPHNINSTATYIGLRVTDVGPVLTNGRVVPKSAIHSQQFNFTVIFTDLDNEAPYYIYVYINLSSYTMSKWNSSDNNYADGVLYQYLTTTINPSIYNYTYRFVCSDGHIVNSTVTYTDLRVINYLPTLTNGTVSPKSAVHSQQFNFTVIYTDLDNESPSYVRVYVNSTYYTMSKWNSSDINFMDGVLYQFLTTALGPGLYNYTYRFVCSDPHNINSTATYTDLRVINYLPTLTNGMVVPTSASHTKQFNFTVIYTDFDNEAPSYVRVYINSTYYTMSKQNSSDTNYTDGVLYRYLTTSISPSVYNYTYRFVCSDPHNINTTVTYTNLRVTNTAPTLTNGTVSPKSASNNNQFNFTVIYTDFDNEVPSYIYVYINSTAYSMSKQNSSDNNYTDGVLYRYLTTSISPSVYNYTYRFACSDGHISNSTTTHTDLRVTNVSPTLTNGAVVPKSASHTSQFNFTVIFTDLDNEVPSYIRVYINSSYYSMSKQNTSDNNYADGVLYYYLTSISTPSAYNYTYRFVCSDGHIVNSTATYIDLRATNVGPMLTNAIVVPKSASHTKQFNFTVIYTDLDNEVPSYIRLYINSTVYTMSKWNSSDTNYTDGVLYRYLISTLTPSIYNYTYRFECSDGHIVNSTITYTDLRVTNTAPTLTNGTVIPKIASHTKQLNFTVIYTDLDNEVPSYIRLYINSTMYTMSKQYSGDINYTDGVLYRYLVTLSLSSYNYTYRFSCSDGHIANNTVIYTDLNVINYPATLTNSVVVPTTGNRNTTFNFTVIYIDLDNEAPTSITVVINGTSHAMSKQIPSDVNYTDGVLYKYTTTLATALYNYTYRFSCNDGHVINSTVDYYNLMVIEPNNFSPRLISPSVSPQIGLDDILYNFTIWYFDDDDNLPVYVMIKINYTAFSMKKANSLDSNATDGILYYFNTTLNYGYYQFQINCSDYKFTNLTSWIIGPEVNPFYNLQYKKTIFEDNFERASLGANWTLTGSGGVSTQTSNSGIYSAYHNANSGEITSKVFDLSLSQICNVSYWVRRGSSPFSENPDSGENFIVEYYNNVNTWVQLDIFLGGGTAGEIFFRNLSLPSQALHSNFRIRFRQTSGSGTGYDYWHFDDFKITTGVEFNLLTPVNNSVFFAGWLNFTWSNLLAPCGPVNFTLQISNMSDFSNIIYESNNILEKPLISNLYIYLEMQSSKYYWRVRPTYNSLKGNWTDYFLLEKDHYPPLITILYPIQNQVFGKSSPNFNQFILEPFLNTTWYSLNGGLNYTFLGLSGTINQLIWNAYGNGTVTIRFYANDTAGNVGFTEIILRKDIISPVVNIISPTSNQLCGNTSITFQVSIVEPNVHKNWYSLNGGLNYTFTGTSGTINQAAWNTCGNGTVMIRFYTNDTANNLGFSEVVVRKDTHFPEMTIVLPINYQMYISEVPNYELTVIDPNLHTIWYTLNNGSKYVFTSLTGTINTAGWNACSDGRVTISFYANNTVGNIMCIEVKVYKNQRLVPKDAYAIVVGISNYPGSDYDLNYCDDDARDIYNMLINDYNFKPENIIYLTDSSGNKNAINNAFAQIASKINSNDIFFFYYSGHGTAATVNAGTQSSSIQSSHPYSNNYDNTWSIYYPDAAYMRVHFAQFETESGYDDVYVGDTYIADGYAYYDYYGYHSAFWSGWVPILSDHRIYIRLITDVSETYYGFRIDSYEVETYTGVHYLCSYDSIPNSPQNYYDDALLNSKLNSLNCAEKYVILDSCMSGGFIPEVQSIGRYIMTACSDDETSLEDPSLQNGVFSYYYLRSLVSATDTNGDGVKSMEECFSYAYSNTVSRSQSMDSIYHPQKYDGIAGEAVLYQSLGSKSYSIVGNILSYSFYIYGTGAIKTINITLCSTFPTLQIKTFDIIYTSPSITGFGYYSGTLQFLEVSNITSFVILVQIDGGRNFKNLLFSYGPDNDSDGLISLLELSTTFTDPLDWDSDNDTLSDGAEFLTYQTNPLDSDSDDDGLSDGAEVNTYHTYPLDSDSDNDGLSDGAEVNTYHTYPLDSDSDNDGYSDGWEVQNGYDPLDPDDPPEGWDKDSSLDDDTAYDNYSYDSNGVLYTGIILAIVFISICLLGVISKSRKNKAKTHYKPQSFKYQADRFNEPDRYSYSPYIPSTPYKPVQPTIAVKTCKKCGATNKTSTKFCMSCGALFKIEEERKPTISPERLSYCTKCGAKIASLNQNFCLKCGNRLKNTMDSSNSIQNNNPPGLDLYKTKLILRNIIMNKMPLARPSSSPEGQRALIVAAMADKKFSEGNVEEAISLMITALKLGVPEPLNSRIKSFLLNAIDLDMHNINSESYTSKFGDRPDVVEINQPSQTAQEPKDLSNPPSDSTQAEIKPEGETKDSSQINLNSEKKTELINEEKQVPKPQDLQEIPKPDLNQKEINDWFELGFECARMGNFKRAVSSFEKVLELNPKDHEAWLNKGLALEALGNYEESINCYGEALKLKPDFDEAKKSLTSLLDKKKQV